MSRSLLGDIYLAQDGNKHTARTNSSHTLNSALFKEAFADESASQTPKQQGRENKTKVSFRIR